MIAHCVKFIPFENKTISLVNSSGQPDSEFLVQGNYVWIHYSLFSVRTFQSSVELTFSKTAMGILTLTPLYIYAFIKKNWPHGSFTSTINPIPNCI